MGNPARRMGPRLALSAFLACSSGLAVGVAAAQPDSALSTLTRFTPDHPDRRGHHRHDCRARCSTNAASRSTASSSPPMGGSTSFAVSDRAGQFTLRSLTPGPVSGARASAMATCRPATHRQRPSVGANGVDLHAASRRRRRVRRASRGRRRRHRDRRGASRRTRAATKARRPGGCVT